MLHRQARAQLRYSTWTPDISTRGEPQRHMSVIQIKVIMIGYLTLRADYVNTVFGILVSAWLGID